ncbi:MAG: hypothetical protein ACI89E_001837, partial [Planctomycetota bacterium]
LLQEAALGPVYGGRIPTANKVPVSIQVACPYSETSWNPRKPAGIR